MNKPVVVFDVLEYNDSVAVVGNQGCTLRVNHGTDFEIVPRDAAPVWSQKDECAYIGTDGYDVEVDTIVNQNAEVFVQSDVFTCDEHDSDIMIKVYLKEAMAKDIALAIEKYVEGIELAKILAENEE